MVPGSIPGKGKKTSGEKGGGPSDLPIGSPQGGQQTSEEFYSNIPVELNMSEVLVDANVKRGLGSKTAIYFGDETYDYRWLQESSNQVANGLTFLGLEIENRYMILLHDCPEFVCAFLGGMRIGAIPVCVNTMLDMNTIQFMIEDSRAKVLITTTEHYEKIKPFRNQLRHLRHIILVNTKGVEPAGIDLRSDVHVWSKLMATAKKTFLVEKTYKNDIGLWLYSSGSTGRPKAAVHMQHDILATTDLYAKQILGIGEDSICFSASKLFFAYGLGNSLTFPLRWGGATVLYPDKPTPDGIFNLLERFKPTHFFGVPTLFAAMLASPGAKDHDLSFLRCIVSAGESLQPAIFQQWKETYGQEILDGIGSTEMLHIFISNRPGEVMPGSSGKLVPGYEARIVDDDWKDVPDGNIGNLLVKGESMAVLYWGRHKKSSKVMLGDWIMTGDLYSRDKDGYYYYAGRSDDMLKVGGIWVSPVEVENAIAELPEVLESAVVGNPDESDLIKPKAYVVLKQGNEATDALMDKIKEHVKKRTSKYKYPRWVEFVQELPKTATGKIQRFKLRKDKN